MDKFLSWEEMRGLARNYFEYYGNLNIPKNFKTLNGYEEKRSGYDLGKWLEEQRQRTVSFFRMVDIAVMKNKGGNLTPEQISEINNGIGITMERIAKLISIGFVISYDSLERINTDMLEEYNIPFSDNSELLNFSPYELHAKINFLEYNNINIIENGKINEIFFMSNDELKEKYNISREELINDYYIEKYRKKHTK